MVKKSKKVAVVSLVFSICSLTCKSLYFQWHQDLLLHEIRGNSCQPWLSWNLVGVVDLASAILAIPGLVLAIMAMRMSPRWLGWVALVLAIFACMNLLIIV